MPNNFLENSIGPTDEELLRKLNTEKRRGEIVEVINLHLMQIAYARSGNECLHAVLDGRGYRSDDRNDTPRMAGKAVRAVEDAVSDLSLIEIGQTCEPVLMEPDLYSESLRAIKNMSEIYGASGGASAAIIFSIDGMDFFLTLDALRYNDRWYLDNSISFGRMLGMDTYQRGLCAYDAGGASLPDDYLYSDTAETLSEILDRWPVHDYDEFFAWAEDQTDEDLSDYIKNYDYTDIQEELSKKLDIDSIEEAADFFAIPRLKELIAIFDLVM